MLFHKPDKLNMKEKVLFESKIVCIVEQQLFEITTFFP